MSQWTFLTNHAHVLVCVTRERDTRLRHIADCVGITERATHRIISDLVEAGYLTKHRLGRRSYYEVHLDLPLRHTLEGDHQLGDLLEPFMGREKGDMPVVRRPATDGSTSPSHSSDSDVMALPG